jgi:hypothetical protein
LIPIDKGAFIMRLDNLDDFMDKKKRRLEVNIEKYLKELLKISNNHHIELKSVIELNTTLDVVEASLTGN